jgi:hypothetical protein
VPLSIATCAIAQALGRRAPSRRGAHGATALLTSATAIISTSAVIPCSPQKFSIRCVFAIPPMTEPATALRPGTIGALLSGGSSGPPARSSPSGMQ